MGNRIGMIEWEDCYGKSWGNIIVPDSYAHPAKFSYKLIKRIYEHMLEMNWIQKGSWVFDPFGGVGLGAYWALRNGLYWVGVELEGKFVELGRQNIELWESKLRISARAILTQGDSRYVRIPMGNISSHPIFDVVVSSPPYAEGIGHVAGKNADKESHPDRYKEQEKYTMAFKSEGNLGSMKEGDFDAIVSSPPFMEIGVGGAKNVVNKNKQCVSKNRPSNIARGEESHNLTYGSSPGQLGGMKEGDFDAIVSSPPFQGSLESKDAKFQKVVRPGRTNQCSDYGESEGQLGAMKEGDFDAIVSSPPFGGAQDGGGINIEGYKNRDIVGKRTYNKEMVGKSEGQLGTMKEGDFDAIVSSPPYEESRIVHYDVTMTNRPRNGDKGVTRYGQNSFGNFWAASKEIVQGCYDLLKPGGYAVWVTKDFVRNKKRVPFSEQWTKLCESVGFEFICGHRAMLVKREVREGLFETDERVTERKSFFRRLAEKKGSPRIDWENVICMRKNENY